MMSETQPTNFSHENEWFYNYNQTSPSSSSFGFSSMAADTTSLTTQTSSSSTSPKPIKRRSRSSKKTPTTLLNANPKNFRALVQQFTGCPRTGSFNTSSSSLLGCQKGPVNLNFQLGRVSVQNDHSTNHGPPASSSSFGSTTFNGYDNHNNNHDHQLSNQSDRIQIQQQVQRRSSEIDVVDHDLEMMMMTMMGDHGVDLTDDIGSNLQQQQQQQTVYNDQNFDHGYFWNYMQNQFPYLSQNN